MSSQGLLLPAFAAFIEQDQRLRNADDADTLVLTNVEQIQITRDNDVRIRCDCACNDLIVVRIARHYARNLFGVNDAGQPRVLRDQLMRRLA